MLEVWNHLYLQVCEFSFKCYSYLTCNLFIDDVDYKYFWPELWWSLSLFMSIWCIIFSLNSSGTDIKKRKTIVQKPQKVKRLKVRLFSAVSFDKNLNSDDSSIFSINEENSEGGGQYLQCRENILWRIGRDYLWRGLWWIRGREWWWSYVCCWNWRRVRGGEMCERIVGEEWNGKRWTFGI